MEVTLKTMKKLFQERGIEFVERGHNSLYVTASSACKLVKLCQEKQYCILGIEGFRISENETRPLDFLVADFSEIDSTSESHDEALLFLADDEAKEASHFDFTIRID